MSIGTKIRILFFILGICCFVTAISLHNAVVTPQNLLKYQTGQLQQRLRAKESLVYGLLSSVRQVKQLNELSYNSSFAFGFIKKYCDKDIDVLIYKAGELQFWSTAKAYPQNIERFKEGSSFAQMPNGYFLAIKKTQDDYVYLFLISVKTQYSIQNKFLVNQISPELFSGKSLQLASFADKETQSVFSIGNRYLFSVKLTSNYNKNNYSSGRIWLWMIGFLFIVLCIKSCCLWLVKQGKLLLATGFLILFFLLFRLTDLKTLWFSSQFDITLFSPSVYAESDFLPSLGAFLLNVISITWVMLFVYIHRKQYRFGKILSKSKIFSVFIMVVYMVTMGLIAFLSENIFSGLIYNSKINFDISDIIGLTWLSWVCIFILCLVWFNIYLLASTFLEVSKTLNITPRQQIFCFLLMLLGMLIYKTSSQFSAYFLLYSFLLFVLWYNSYKQAKKASIGILAIIFFTMSLITSLKYLRFTDIKERNLRVALAEKLLYDDDPKVINALESLEKDLQADSIITKYFKQPLLTQTLGFHNYITKKYLDGYLSKFEYRMYEYNRNDLPFKKEEQISIGKYRNLVQFGAVKTSESFFFYRVNDTFGFQCYFGIIPVIEGQNKLGTMVIELKSLPFDYNNRFPELLIDGKSSADEELQDYSFAFYKNKVLYNQSGAYIYPLYNNGKFTAKPDSITFISDFNPLKTDGGSLYSHVVFKPEPSKIIVVSKAELSFVNQLAAISFFFLVFIFFGIAFNALLWLIKNFDTNQKGWFGVNRYLMINANKILYKTRVQLSIVLAVVATLLIVGWTTFFNIKEDYRYKKEDFFRNKIRKIKVSYENMILNRGIIGNDDGAKYEFNQFADINDAYLNLYDVKGTLYLTSLPKMFDSGIISCKMNPEAYIYLKQQQQSEFLNPAEKVGSFVYAAAYVPVRNAKNETIAYLGMPYYSNQTDYQDKIGFFINTLINIYALVFVLVGVFAVFLANQITAPLSFIQESIKKTKLGERNEPIYWHRQDEIGTLIKEYNKMISELEDSANKLAKSERESAWREMAKQVAHEIKNPLTPLKLGVQLLQKAWKEKDSNFEAKFIKFNKSFLEQIESLSAIASEFSDFAKMPDTKLAEIELLPVLTKAIEVFNNFENIEIVVLNNATRNLKALGDKDQLLCAFNNLLKNAVEACDGKKLSVIRIIINNDDKNVYIDIIDRGKGIEKAFQDKIFRPNFTTKSSGTGLGLAFAKQAIENAGGHINFKSEENVETSFYLTIPLLEG